MIDVMKEAFWLTATQLVELIVPLIGIAFVFWALSSLIFKNGR